MTPEARLEARDREMIPTVLLRALLVLVVCALMITTYAVATDRPLEAMPALDGEATVKAERSIFLSGDGMSGAARVLDANGTVLADLGPSDGGFIAGIHRVLVRERAKQGLGMDQPVRLVLYETGQLSLRDPATGWRAELIGFGAKNADTFAKLLN